RAFRVLPLTVLYFVIAFCVISSFGQPPSPARGPLCLAVDFGITLVTVVLFLAFTFFVLDATYLNTRFIHYLVQGDTHWPYGAHGQFGRMNLEPEDLTEYMDIRLIAMRTKAVGRFVYFPFVILVLMIASRISFFDNW